jgi:protein-tyrosine kinase
MSKIFEALEHAQRETAIDQTEGNALLGEDTHWEDQSIGDLLVLQGKLSSVDVNRIVDYQREKGLYFGEAAVELGLVKQDDILRVLSNQYGYSYGHNEPSSKDMVMATAPFSQIAEEFRSIRAHLLYDWLTPDRKTLAVVSPGNHEGRSYFAANIALAFSQLGRSTLLIDADLRFPRQHEIFSITTRIGISTLLAGRVKMEQLDQLPDKVSAFPHLSVLGSGPVPPNPSELLASTKFTSILREIEKYFDVIIIDTPAAIYRSDVLSLASGAGSALLLARSGHSSVKQTKVLTAFLNKSKARIVGAVLNQF